jgi:hypothetical protein
VLKSFVAAGLVLGLAGVAAAGRTDKTAVAVRATGAVTIDGRLDEATWTGAAFVSDFAQKEPDQDAPPTERTAIALAFDGDALYVAARMELADPARLDRPMTRRDDTSGAERIIVSFDPYRSRRTAYSFAVTAAGVRADWVHTDDSEYERDHSWNPVWKAAVSHGDAAWTAEMRIPFSQLRFPDDPTPVWGVNFNRYVPRSGEDDFWVVVPKDVTGWSSYFGELRGLDGVEQKLRLEVLPYVTGDMTVGLGTRRDEGGWSGDAGVDLKVGLGPDLTLDATVNPDFGQVEADPAVVNLSAYEVIFPEQRPFFVEGAQIFSSQPRSYFYSRRIGADDARILGAAKLSGQAIPRHNVGALAAITARTDDAPLAGWGVLRIEREVDASLVGLTVTGVGRDIEPGDEVAEAALTGGGDVTLRLDGGRYEIFAGAGGSTVSGSPAAITAIQTAPAHYFQRPDATHIGVDPDATRISGWHADLRASRRAGDWRFDAAAGAESPGLELNDVGILNSADDVDASLALARVETEPGRHLHGWRVGLYDGEEWSFAGDHKPAFTQGTVELTLPSFHRLFFDAAVTRPGVRDDKTRGGPLMGAGWGASWGVAVNSHNSGRWVWGANLGGDWSETEATGLGAGASVLWHASPELRIQVAPRYRAGTVHHHYVDAVAGTQGGDETFGVRYVFGSLELREIAVQFRTQLSLTPDLTIDAYVEPFASEGRVTRFGELPAPRRRDLTALEIDYRGEFLDLSDGTEVFRVAEPDFLVGSLRSTVVLRWEYLPGSILYAVWQQDRAEDDRFYTRRLGDALGDSFTASGTHVVALKLSYWWSP